MRSKFQIFGSIEKPQRQLGFHPKRSCHHLYNQGKTGRSSAPRAQGQRCPWAAGTPVGEDTWWELKPRGRLGNCCQYLLKAERDRGRNILISFLFLLSNLQQVLPIGQTWQSVSRQWKPSKCALQRGGEIGSGPKKQSPKH